MSKMKLLLCMGYSGWSINRIGRMKEMNFVRASILCNQHLVYVTAIKTELKQLTFNQ